jgi:hypothetical protein
MKQLKETLIKKFTAIKPSKRVIAFCDGLRTIGVDAKLILEPMDLRGVCVANISGIIEIQHESPIHWVILIMMPPMLESSGGEETVYIVPDSKLDKNMKKINLKMVKLRNIPMIGKAKYVYWKGKDSDRRVIDSLNNDHDLMNRLMQLPRGLILRISSHYSSGGSGIFNYPKMPSCWRINPLGIGKGHLPPSNEEWNCYQLIAQHLLGERTIGSQLITNERKQGIKAIWFYKFLRILFILLFWLLFLIFWGWWWWWLW